MAFSSKQKMWTGIIVVALGIAASIYFFFPTLAYNSVNYAASSVAKIDDVQSTKPGDVTTPQPIEGVPVTTVPTVIPVTHMATPDHVKAIYLSSWVAGGSKYRDPLIKLADQTEVNAVVIDVKDSTGRISFPVSDPKLAAYGSVEKRIPDIRTLTNTLHQKHIYIIGRVAVFQDPYMTKAKPEWAITKKSDGTVWKDHKGLSFLDPANTNVHEYIVAIAQEAYNDGFDEINFDYIRYPSDGDLKNINYHLVDGKTRADNIEAFFKYLSENVKKNDPIVMSGDLFGLTTEVNDDMGIGQVWDKALPYFDYLCPMIYPSHYPAGYDGFKNPADHPYEVITRALAGAVKKTKAMNMDIQKIRPWLQDFNLGAVYTADLVKAQMKATYDAGLTSWLLWDPNNKYTPAALSLETTQ
jgi:hypothetical protein